MILDNENENLKVHEWISKYTKEGQMSVVTGYFTVGGLAFFSKKTKDLIEEYKFVLGDIVNFDEFKESSLDLLNENITVDASLRLSSLAKEAVRFLELDKVEAKTLEPNFCHAKAYLFADKENEAQNNYYITGSSNLTDAGIGRKVTSNVELNIAGFGSEAQYDQLIKWFEELWKRPQAHDDKTIRREDGTLVKIPFKQYLIDEIKKIFQEYTPRELYYKILFELFGEELLLEKDNPDFNRQIGRLENTIIYNELYEFQQKGVLSLIKMLQRFDGAILADAVGLGKTWSALAVMKFYELQGREVILLCPKKLSNNWSQYLKRSHSKFEKDQFDYLIRYHTDLSEDRINSYREDISFLTNQKPKLFVIDESHNLRNDKSKRYRYFVDEILKKCEDVKVLMLSATPINNSLIDIRNQFKLVVAGDTSGFYESLDIRNLDYTFRAAQKAFNEWTDDPRPRIGDFIKKLPSNFFKLTDSLTVARTRKMIEGHQNNLTFPVKEKPENVFVTPKQIGNFESFEELFDHFPPRLSGYQPAFYVEQIDDIDKLHDERQRDFFLVKMMYILLIKRLESSWAAFQSTVDKILAHHQNALNRIKQYQEVKNDLEVEDDQLDLFGDDDELSNELDEFTLGKKRKIQLSEIDDSGMLELFKKDLKEDIEALQLLQANLYQFDKKIASEIKKPRNLKSEDDKLEALMSRIVKKRQNGSNNGNEKVLIFTVYKDTAFYLFDQLKARGFEKLAVVSGETSRTWNSDQETKKFEEILERFCPYTKLFREKEWDYVPSTDEVGLLDQFDEWQKWISDNDSRTFEKLNNPIDILIATDALSEGQNMQDCDFVINYDIHWNPVRVIQRMGRIDRLGSPNERIFGLNFWPSNNINSYLNLQGRIEQRMAAMKLAGSEVDLQFSDTFKEMAENESLEQKQKAKMMEQMQTSWEDIEVSDQTLGFDDLSLETYRQELLEELKSKEKYYKYMPKGVYTGFKSLNETCPESGLIALFGFPARPPKKEDHKYKTYDLVYIDDQGKSVLSNQKEILDALTQHKDTVRYVPKALDQGSSKEVDQLSDTISKWLKSQAVQEEEQEDGTVKETMGSSALDLINKLKGGKKEAVNTLKESKSTIKDRYKNENYDLITWFIVTS